MAQELNRHLAAVMFTDIAGYTLLMQDDEGRARKARERHREALESAVSDFGGQLLQYFGDGGLSLFPSAVAGASAAVRIQGALGTSPNVPLRIGLHLGDVAYDEQGAYGTAINIAARLESLSAPGGVLVSDTVYQQLSSTQDFPAVPLGPVELKNVRRPVPVFALSGEGLSVPDLGGQGPRGVEQSEPGHPEEDTSQTGWLADLDSAPAAGVFQTRPVHPSLQPIGLIGREAQLQNIKRRLERSEARQPPIMFLSGERGVGKSRLAMAAAELAHSEGWITAVGRGYPAEQRMPYALLSDALGPLGRRLGPKKLEHLLGASAGYLAPLFPGLEGLAGSVPVPSAVPAEMRHRMLWVFTEFLQRIGKARPLMLVVDDLQWADESSLDLIHFASRHLDQAPVLILATFSEGPGGEEPTRVLELERSLLAMGAATSVRVDPLTLAATGQLVRETFHGRPPESFSRSLFELTRGNPFFIEGMLRGLVDEGRLRLERHRWRGWSAIDEHPPQTVRDGIKSRLGSLSAGARAMAEVAAVVGAKAPSAVLLKVSRQHGGSGDEALEELTRLRYLNEFEHGRHVVYEFTHPLIGEVLLADLSLTVRRRLHAAVAGALEEIWADDTHEHVDELAYHFARARGAGSSLRAVRYLAAAGARAAARHADHEAVTYLEEALERLDVAPQEERTELASEITGGVPGVVAQLARVKSRLGDYDGSVAMWQRVLTLAENAEDAEAIGSARRQLGLAHLWSGRLELARQHLRVGIEAAETAGRPMTQARVLLAEGVALQQLGRSAQALEVVGRAETIAIELGSDALMARVHRTLIQIHLWNGDFEKVREHGAQALELAERIGDAGVAFWSHWAVGVMENMRGNIGEMWRRLARARELADELRSPVLRLWTAELEMEHAFAAGDWDEGIEMGLSAVAEARALNQYGLLPSLLVILGFIHLGKGQNREAKVLFDEAWEVSDAGHAEDPDRPTNVHTVVSAIIGMTAYHLAVRDLDSAIQVGETGLAVADRAGYVAWGVHRLLPLLGEAHVRARNLDRAGEIVDRLRENAQRMRHPLGFAWVMAGEALLAWLRGDPRRGAERMREAVDALEAIPMVWEAAQIRRQLAGRLVDIGDVEGAIEELLGVRETFERLGAEGELQMADDQLRDVGIVPPARRG